MVIVHLKDGTSQTFSNAGSVQPYAPDALFTAVTDQSNNPLAAFVTSDIEWVGLI